MKSETNSKKIERQNFNYCLAHCISSFIKLIEEELEGFAYTIDFIEQKHNPNELELVISVLPTSSCIDFNFRNLVTNYTKIPDQERDQLPDLDFKISVDHDNILKCSPMRQLVYDAVNYFQEMCSLEIVKKYTTQDFIPHSIFEENIIHSPSDIHDIHNLLTQVFDKIDDFIEIFNKEKPKLMESIAFSEFLFCRTFNKSSSAILFVGPIKDQKRNSAAYSMGGLISDQGSMHMPESEVKFNTLLRQWSSAIDFLIKNPKLVKLDSNLKTV